MEKNTYNLPSENLKENGAENKSLSDLSGDQLLDLIKKGKITNNLLSTEAKKKNISLLKIGFTILEKSNLLEEFMALRAQNGNVKTIEDNEILLISFFKIQQQPNVVEAETVTGSEVKTSQTVLEAEKSKSLKTGIEEEQASEKETQQIPIPKIISPTQSPEQITEPGKKEWWEVKRETEVMAIEDLDGDMRNFERHVRKLGVAEKDSGGKWNWTGGNKKLVFLGDILGDRSMDGMEITSIIGNLREQAEKQGGQVDFLCGNHDMDFILFLSRTGGDKYAENNAELFTDQSIGLWELAKFDPDPKSELKKVNPFVEHGPKKGWLKEEFKAKQKELWPKLYDRTPEILSNMRSTKEGREILEDICKLKVAVVHDDTLFCHTDPTVGMAFDLMKGGDVDRKADEINKIFQANLRNMLFAGDKPDDGFWDIMETYLNADNRRYFTEKGVDKEKAFMMIAGDLMSKIAESLYAKGDIVFSSEARKILDKNGYLGMAWKTWDMILNNKDSFVDMSIDEKYIQKNIENWRAIYPISGEYADEVVRIFTAFKNRDFAKRNESQEELFEKIKKYNSEERMVEKVRELGINTILHGHSPVEGGRRFYDKNGLVIVSPHAHFDSKHGTSIVRRNGKIELEGRDFREKVPAQAKKSPQIPNQPSVQEREREEIEREIKVEFAKLRELNPPNSRKFAKDLEYVMKDPNGKMYDFHPQTKLDIVKRIIGIANQSRRNIFEYVDAFIGDNKNDRFEINTPGLNQVSEIGEIPRGGGL